MGHPVAILNRRHIATRKSSSVDYPIGDPSDYRVGKQRGMAGTDAVARLTSKDRSVSPGGPISQLGNNFISQSHLGKNFTQAVFSGDEIGHIDALPDCVAG